MSIEKIKILGAVLELPAKQHWPIWPIYQEIGQYVLNWQCCLAASSKTTLRIFYFFFKCRGCQTFILHIWDSLLPKPPKKLTFLGSVRGLPSNSKLLRRLFVHDFFLWSKFWIMNSIKSQFRALVGNPFRACFNSCQGFKETISFDPRKLFHFYAKINRLIF